MKPERCQQIDKLLEGGYGAQQNSGQVERFVRLSSSKIQFFLHNRLYLFIQKALLSEISPICLHTSRSQLHWGGCHEDGSCSQGD